MFEKINYLMLEPTTICNLSCVTCARKNLISSGMKIESISQQKLGSIIEQFPYLDYIRFHGMGELFLLYDHLELLFVLRQLCPKTHIDIFTNGQYKKIDEYAISEAVDGITISIDSTTKDLYEKLRVGGNFETLCQNLDKFTSVTNKIEGNFVCSPKNILELQHLPDFCLKHKLQKMRINIVQNWNNDLDKSLTTFYLPYLKQNLEICFEKAKKYGLDFKLMGNENFQINQCEWMHNRIFVAVNGDVLPCCMRQDKKYKLGNLFVDSITDIMTSSYVNDLKTYRSTGMCKYCPYVVNKQLLKELK